MTCKAILQEFNSQKQCWLPVEPSSPFQLCNRCTFHKVESTLDTILHHLDLFHNIGFLQCCSKEAHWPSLLLALGLLFLQDERQFHFVYRNFHSYDFQQFLRKETAVHLPSKRCAFYRFLLREKGSKLHFTDLPWQCADCISWVLRQKDMMGCYEAFSNGFARKKLGPVDNLTLINMMVSLELQKKSHIVRILLAKRNDLLIEFLSQPSLLSLVYLDKVSHLTSISLSELSPLLLRKVKQQMDPLKEELMQKTWAPERLFQWCLDIEELKDFPSPFGDVV